MPSMASPFETFGSQEASLGAESPRTGGRTPRSPRPPPLDANVAAAGALPLSPSKRAYAPPPAESPRPGVGGDVYRSYSLMDVAFWDFGVKDGAKKNWYSMFFGTPGAASPKGPASGPNSSGNSSSSSGAGMDCSNGVCKRPSSVSTSMPSKPATGTWSAWMFGGGGGGK